jgi:hypothetical protein
MLPRGSVIPIYKLGIIEVESGIKTALNPTPHCSSVLRCSIVSSFFRQPLSFLCMGHIF